eukprot:14791073-Ditylum_brightwellii.AAC.1
MFICWLINDYNQLIGGVGIMDQYISYYLADMCCHESFEPQELYFGNDRCTHDTEKISLHGKSTKGITKDTAKENTKN